MFETVFAAPLREFAERLYADANPQRGVFVLRVAGAGEDDADARLAEGRRVFTLLRVELAPAKAAKLAAAITGAPRKALYHVD
jgi:16S rRNA (cytidine1402-2'-O)-methyltransferase